MAIALGIGALGYVQDALSSDDSSQQSAAVDANGAPLEWPLEVRPIAAFVEAERGLSFVHPVHIDFVPEAEFVELFSSDSGEIDQETIDYYAAQSDIYDASGFAANYDALEGQSTLSAVSILGWYSPSSDSILIRGDELTPSVRVTLAHELVHALQAQHFDLNLNRPDDFALRTVIEADAERVERVYIDSLSPADRSTATGEQGFDADQADAVNSVPAALVAHSFAPYVLGPLLIDTVYEQRGNAGVNELLSSPPTEEILINPWMWGQPANNVTPHLLPPAGATLLDAPYPASMLNTLLILDGWLPWTEARGALDGWIGGESATYQLDTPDAPTCIALALSFDDPTRFAAAITAWSAAAGSSAQPVVNDKLVTFEACERGAGAANPPTQDISTIDAIVFEHLVLAGPEGAPSPEDIPALRCWARAMIDNPTVAPLIFEADVTDAQADEYDRIDAAVAAQCGLNPAI